MMDSPDPTNALETGATFQSAAAASSEEEKDVGNLEELSLVEDAPMDGLEPELPLKEPVAERAEEREENLSADKELEPIEKVEKLEKGDEPSSAKDITASSAELLLNQSEGEAAVTPSDGIEILVRMAQKNEIDPKAVDIIDVTDKFLKAIAAAPKENLRQSGKILFHACVLLRMKAEALLFSMAEEEPVGDDFLDFDDDGSPIVYDSQENLPRQITLKDLEKAIVRKVQRKRERRRQVTLEELIEALKEAERIEKTRAEKKPKARIDLAGHHEVNAFDDILELAHDEDIESTIERVEQLLTKLLKIGENIELFAVVNMLESKHPGDWVDAFLAALFLSNAGKIDLEQFEFYGPLYLTLCTDTDTKTDTDTTVADTVNS